MALHPRENGSPAPVFETDDNRSYFLCTNPVHPLAKNVSVSDRGLRRDIDTGFIFNSLKELNDYLRSGGELSWNQVETKLRMELQNTHIAIIDFCQLPRSRAEILEHIGLFNNTRNFNNYIKPLVDLNWVAQTHPDKPTSKTQQYYTTEVGKKLMPVTGRITKSGIQSTSLASSNIASAGYDSERMILELEFHDGAVYQYFDVPEKVYTGLINAPSHTAYYMYEVKGKYIREKIEK